MKTISQPNNSPNNSHSIAYKILDSLVIVVGILLGVPMVFFSFRALLYNDWAGVFSWGSLGFIVLTLTYKTSKK